MPQDPEDLAPPPDAQSEDEEPQSSPIASMLARAAAGAGSGPDSEKSPPAAPEGGPKLVPEGDEPATRENYDALMADLPTKLTAEQAGYEEAPKDQKEKCGNCAHGYKRNNDQWNVCELVQVEDDAEINPEWYCNFWDGGDGTLPLLKEKD
jgi:hypothetical protein